MWALGTACVAESSLGISEEMISGHLWILESE